MLADLKKVYNALADLEESIKLGSKPSPKPRMDVNKAISILISKLRCGYLKSIDITQNKLMYEQGFTELESIEILKALNKEGLL